MADLKDADLDSELIDLADIPLGELRDLASPELVAALEHVYALAASNTGNELQVQKT